MSQDTPGAGHNSELTDDEKRALFLFHVGQVAEAKRKKDEAVANLRNVYKKAKADECPKADIDFAMGLDDDEALREQRRREETIARWMGLEIGAEPSLLDELERMPSVDKAYEEGKRAGAAGEDRVSPYDQVGEQTQHWLRGHGDGQALIASAMKKLDRQPESELIKGAKPEADDFDALEEA